MWDIHVCLCTYVYRLYGFRVLCMWDIHVVYAHLSIGFDVQRFRV
jgi:hypothetical protein